MPHFRLELIKLSIGERYEIYLPQELGWQEPIGDCTHLFFQKCAVHFVEPFSICPYVYVVNEFGRACRQLNVVAAVFSFLEKKGQIRK